jgi:uncharacterized protein (UPF0261 family)
VKRVYVVGTHDTKAEELSYLAGLMAAQGLAVARVDVSTRESPMPSIPRQNIIDKFHTMIAAGIPIIGGGAGMGLSAKAEEGRFPYACAPETPKEGGERE